MNGRFEWNILILKNRHIYIDFRWVSYQIERIVEAALIGCHNPLPCIKRKNSSYCIGSATNMPNNMMQYSFSKAIAKGSHAQQSQNSLLTSSEEWWRIYSSRSNRNRKPPPLEISPNQPKEIRKTFKESPFLSGPSLKGACRGSLPRLNDSPPKVPRTTKKSMKSMTRLRSMSSLH